MDTGSENHSCDTLFVCYLVSFIYQTFLCLERDEHGDDTRPGEDFAILGIALLIVVADVVLIPFFRCEYFSGAYDRFSMVIITVFDFCMVSIAGVLGLFFAARIGASSWWHPGTDSSASKQVSVNALLLGTAMVAFNTFSIVYYRGQLPPVSFSSHCMGSCLLFTFPRCFIDHRSFSVLIFLRVDSSGVWIHYSISHRVSTRLHLLSPGSPSSYDSPFFH